MTRTEAMQGLKDAASALTKAARIVKADASAIDWKSQGCHLFMVTKFILDKAGVKDPKVRKATYEAVVAQGHGFGMNASQFRQWSEETDKATEIAQNLTVEI